MKKFMSLVVGAGTVVVFALAFTGAPRVASAGHVGCGDTIVTDTILDGDLDCTGDNGLFIGADNIKLDLGGNTLKGDPIPAGIAAGVSIGGVTGVTIKNGTIEGFFRGITADGVSDLRLRNLIFEGQIASFAIAIAIGNSREVSIKHSSFFGPVPVNGETPIAIFLIFVEDVEVRNIDVHGYRTGVEFACDLCDGSEPPSNGEVKRSAFSGNFIGVDVRNSSNVEISENHMSNCFDRADFPCNGISVGFTGVTISGVTIEDNHIHNNREGILLSPIFDSEISGNHVRDNTLTGISLKAGSDGNEIESNLTSGSGVDLFHDGPSTPNTWVNNSCDTKDGADIPAC